MLSVDPMRGGDYLYSGDHVDASLYGAMTAAVARAGFDITVSPETMANWNDALILIQAADDVVDGPRPDLAVKLSEFFENYSETGELGDGPPPEVAIALGGIALDSMVRLDSNLNRQQIQGFLRNGLAIIRLSEAMGNETDPRTYGAFAQRESVLTSLMYGSVMSPTEQEHPRFPELIEFFKRVGGAFNTLDSICDLRADYASGLTQVKPSLATYSALSLEAWKSTNGERKNLGNIISDPQVLSFAAPVLKGLYGDRFRSRKRASYQN